MVGSPSWLVADKWPFMPPPLLSHSRAVHRVRWLPSRGSLSQETVQNANGLHDGILSQPCNCGCHALRLHGWCARLGHPCNSTGGMQDWAGKVYDHLLLGLTSGLGWRVVDRCRGTSRVCVLLLLPLACEWLRGACVCNPLQACVQEDGCATGVLPNLEVKLGMCCALLRAAWHRTNTVVAQHMLYSL
jgi:hypothetical protein